MTWILRSYLVAADQEDLAAGELWEAGTVGLESRTQPDGRLRVDAWFRGGDDAAPAAAPDPLAHRLGHGVELLSAAPIADQDWLATYRERAGPFPLGVSFWVDPREPDGAGAAPAGRRLLRLPARTAFGTGSHESTRLAVELLEDLPVAGRRVLDVGTGTGVLSFAAEHLGARRVVAFDVDVEAVVQARGNAALNGFTPVLFTGTVEALAPGVRFDVALINIVPEIIVPEMPDVAALLDGGAEGAEMVLSGILDERAGEVVAAAAALGFPLREARRAGGWVALRVARAG